MIKNKAVISLAVFLSLGCLGLLFPAVGASLPAMEQYFGGNLSSSGNVSSLVQLGYALFCFFGGILGDFFGKKRILIFGALIYGLSGLLLTISPNWLLTNLLFFLYGSGSGMIFITSNTLVIELFSKKPGTFLNLHHSFFSVGSLLAPLIVRNLLLRNHPWYTTFQLLSLIAIFLAAVLIFSNLNMHINKKETGADGLRLKEKYREVLGERSFIKLLVVLFFSMGVQFGIIYLLVSYLVKVRAVEFGAASLVMSGFFGLILIGRLSCSYLVSRLSPHKVVLVLLVMLIITLTLGWLTQGMPSYLFFALTGLASSGLMPTMISIAGSTMRPEIRGTMLGILSMVGGLGGMLVTLTVTKAAAVVGFNNSFALMIILSVAAALLFIGLQRERVKAVNQD